MTTQSQQPKRSILGFGRKPAGDDKAKDGAEGGVGRPSDLAPPQAKAEADAATLAASDSPAGGGTPPAPAEPVAPPSPSEAATTASGRVWAKGPDPSVDPCPKGDATAATLWRKRKVILDKRGKITSIQESLVDDGKEERAAYDEWARRQQAEADRAAARVSRSAGVSAGQIGQLAELAKTKGVTVDELLKLLQGPAS